LLLVKHMHDNGIGKWSPLCGIDTEQSLLVRCVGT